MTLFCSAWLRIPQPVVLGLLCLGLPTCETQRAGALDSQVVELTAAPALPPAELRAPVAYWQETRREPRPLRLHFLRVDVASRDLEVVALVAPDPDGDGAADATLTDPLTLAAQAGALAAVNANAFGGLPDRTGTRDSNWLEGKPVEILGWALQGSREASTPRPGYASVWADGKGKSFVADLAEPRPAVAAAGGFSQILRDGRNLCGDDKPLHPRTAAGVDATGRWLWLVVVDGRQSGISEGMTTLELAELMKNLGCDDALNLDGGGSSIMVIADPEGKPQIVNQPSGGRPRPVPVMFGIRRRGGS